MINPEKGRESYRGQSEGLSRARRDFGQAQGRPLIRMMLRLPLRGGSPGGGVS